MAINKNFVIKNGVQVNTNLIVGDSTTNKVGVGTTTPGYTLHVGGSRGGIGATDLNITGVGSITNLNVLGVSTFANDVSVSGMVSAQALSIGTTEVIDRGMRLSGIASLDATTTATIEEAIRVGPNSFSDLKVAGISTFVGVATFLGGIDVNVRSGVSTFSAPVQFGIAPIDGQAGLSSNFVAVGATVGFGTTAYFRDNAAIFMGDGSDLKIHHDGSNSYIQDVGTGDLIVRGSADIKLQSASSENYLVANDTGSVDIYFDNSKKVETTSGGLKVTGITTLTDRLFVEAGISTFVGDVRFGIGATVGFGTSAFFRDDAAIFLGNDSDLKIHHDGSNSYVEDIGTGDLILKGPADIKLQSASGESYIVANDTGSVEVYYDNSKKLESTSGGLNVTGITTFSDRINVVSGVSTFQDSAKLTFGAQSDLIVWHDGSHSYLQDTTGTGNLYVDSNSLQIRNAAGNETQATFAENGAVSLYYDNGDVFQTTPQGINVSGVTTSNRLNISGISTFGGDLDINANIDVSGNTVLNGDVDLGNATSDTITATGRFDSDIVPSTDNARDLGASGLEFKDLYIDGTANIDALLADTAKIGDLTDNRVVIAGSSGELEDDANLTFDGAKFNVGSGVTIQPHGGVSIAGIVTVGGDLNVQGDIVYDEITGRNLNITGISTQAGQVNFGTSGVGATVYSNGNVTISGIATVGSDLVVFGNLDVTGDISYDEVTGRNINISGVTTLGSGAGGGVMVTPVGAGATIGNANGAGIVTYYGDGAYLTNIKAGVGIGSTTGLVGYGFTYIHFNGPGVSTVYADARPDFVGYATVFIQGGGSSTVGAAGTWTPEGSIGISTSKSVGINTTALNDPDVQGIGNSFQGLYIGNGMLMVDNALNGNHYIGTNFNGMMAGPVTINGVLTIDGNYVVV